MQANSLEEEIYKSFKKLERILSEEILEEVRNTAEKHLGRFNLGVGTMIRLKMLQPRRRLYQRFLEAGYKNKDEMTMELLKKYRIAHR